ncbi:PepSY domain-containing protein [Alkalihalobacillus oceani]|uniref:PepSY-associated TM helix domain-containing protein n=1 Tax=Halalkalibacter oceani TaxID=1653776 RepID=UPI00203A6811|nr:PepSY domain-containing protein [Halalkalibacter oceani]MCM3759188.1 PepSY domain-containing protein [Halalkalibacter oceani]
MNESEKSKKTKTSIYQTVWRWHFYAGVIFAPIIFILAFSGGVYLFKPQIEAYLYQDLIKVNEVEDTRLSYTDQMNRVREQYPDAQISSVTIPEDKERTIEFAIRESGVAASVFVNPYNGQIQGALENDQKVTEIFKKLHSELWIAGTIGNRIVELAASWAIILIVTGLYMWWPRNRNSMWGTLLPRLNKRGRVFWRDLHAVPAFWLSLFILILIATGLPWSGVLGPKIQDMAAAPQYAYSYGEKPESVTLTKDLVEDVPWATENLDVPSSLPSTYLPLSIDEVESLVDGQGLAYPFTITLPVGKLGVYTASHVDSPRNLATIHLDQYSGVFLSDVRFDDFSFAAKVIESGIALHEGRLFGWLNQLLGLLTCLGLMLIVVSSFFMWKKRKPQGGFGAPSQSKNTKVNIVVWLILLVFGFLMPLVGISLLVMFILDQVLRPLLVKLR